MIFPAPYAAQTNEPEVMKHHAKNHIIAAAVALNLAPAFAGNGSEIIYKTAANTSWLNSPS
jgi:hypothetical protein